MRRNPSSGTAAEDVDAFMKPLADFDAMRCWGELWARPGLSTQDRSFISVALSAAESRFDELETHVRAALVLGCSVEQLQEVLLIVGTHSGRDTLADALRVVRSVVSRQPRSRWGGKTG